MTSPDRVLGALETLLAELTDCRRWQADLVAETARAASRQKALADSVRSVIEALPAPARRAQSERLCRLLGVPRIRKHGHARPTARTRAALAWMAARENAEFHVADLTAHFRDNGQQPARGYVPTLLNKFKKRGIVQSVSHGRYRVNREHPELLG